MHYGTEVGILGKVIGYNFTKGFREESFIYVLNGVMDVFFLGGNPPLGVFVRHYHKYKPEWGKKRGMVVVIIGEGIAVVGGNGSGNSVEVALKKKGDTRPPLQ
jgi:hypothetical protein